MTVSQKLNDNNIVSLEMSSIPMSYYIFYLLESFVKKPNIKKKGGSCGGNYFVSTKVLLMTWKIFPSPSLKPKVAVVNKHLSLELSHVHMSFVCVVLVMALANASNFPVHLLRLSNCHD